MASIPDEAPGSRSSPGPAPEAATARRARAQRAPSRHAEPLDAQEQSELEQALGRAERCQLALQAAGVAVFEWRADSGELMGAQELLEVLGGGAGAAEMRLEDFLERVHPQDRQALEAALRAALEQRAHIDREFRLALNYDAVRWLRLRAQVPERDAEPLRLLGVCEDITESKWTQAEQAAVTRSEQERRTAAEQRSSAQGEVLSMFSHELRSPLNAILGWNRILAVKRAEDAEVAAITTRIERGARTQLQMLNDLLDFSRLNAGTLELASRPVRLARSIGAALAAARAGAAAKGVELASELADPSPEVWGDPERLQQLSSQLLANAIRFTPAGGRVLVRVYASDAQVVLEVIDSGAGIAPEQLAGLFAGPRARPAGAGVGGGLGIGLAMVREIATLHAGAVEAHSEGLGRGSRFSVRLPLLREPRAQGAPQAGVARLAGLSILVVDDEADARAVVAESLRLEGAQVAVSDSAAGALEALQAPGARFDAMITDIGMPVEDGYSLLRKVRRSRRGRELLAIALTGYARPIDRDCALQAGFDVHVPKPVDFAEFVPLVAALVRAARRD